MPVFCLALGSLKAVCIVTFGSYASCLFVDKMTLLYIHKYETFLFGVLSCF